jgi:hypothetical protein
MRYFSSTILPEYVPIFSATQFLVAACEDELDKTHPHDMMKQLNSIEALLRVADETAEVIAELTAPRSVELPVFK